MSQVSATSDRHNVQQCISMGSSFISVVIKRVLDAISEGSGFALVRRPNRIEGVRSIGEARPFEKVDP